MLRQPGEVISLMAGGSSELARKSFRKGSVIYVELAVLFNDDVLAVPARLRRWQGDLTSLDVKTIARRIWVQNEDEDGEERIY